jgi:hypothetical protein
MGSIEYPRHGPRQTLAPDSDFGYAACPMDTVRALARNHPRPEVSEAGRRKRYARSRVTNGSDILPDVDGRSFIARRFRDISEAVAREQSGELSEVRLQLIRRFSAAAVLAEMMEARLARGEQIDVGEHSQLSSTMVRIAQRIGVNKIPVDVTPSLESYLSNNHPTPANGSSE